MVTQEQQAQLVRPFSANDAEATIKDLNTKEFPSPRGTPVFFYKKVWELVG